ncbi:MAG: acetyl-CoA carboxylase biotin carboxyl carrier protein [Deinococcota bacterium]|jgi:acetyl-CoA carboxylase biotin carboxyl carrier protein|nr:acetyl-CoA carboxylase biotin carboxyl carrier protein [Deinococcota bacterium]
MDVKELKRLLDAMRDSETNELVLETGDYKLTVKRGAEAQMIQAPQPPAAAVPTSQPGAPEAARGAPTPASVPAHLVQITAPIVGTFYASPSPDAAPYVKVGDKVEAGKVLCIIEAMKLMNEIEAEVAGVIAEVLVKNEEPVEYGQVLFRIDPS